jgi:hypothetical protein
MKKEELYQALIIGEYISFVFATILVVLFQFLGIGLIITFALAMYVVAFGICCFENIVLAVNLYKQKDEVNIDKPQIEVQVQEGQQVAVKNANKDIKKQKIKAIIIATMSGIISIFTLVVMILFN